MFRSLPVSEIPGGSKNSQSCDADVAHEDSTKGLTRIFIHHLVRVAENVTLSSEDLGTISKSYLRIRTIWARDKLSHPSSPLAVILSIQAIYASTAQTNRSDIRSSYKEGFCRGFFISDHLQARMLASRKSAIVSISCYVL